MRSGSIITATALATALLAFTYAATATDLKEVNIKFMLRGYCFAASPTNTLAPHDPAGNWNVPKPLSQKNYGAAGELSLVVFPMEQVPFNKEYRGFRLLLVNRTGGETNLASCDMRLSIVQEALQGEGLWRPVEYLPASWCGNSYYSVTLPSAHYWEFAAPRYTGTIKAPLRFVLNIEGEAPIFSKVFEGSINPEQFTEKQGHSSTNLMDPYNE
jgi:hypothetical protein